MQRKLTKTEINKLKRQKPHGSEKLATEILGCKPTAVYNFFQTKGANFGADFHNRLNDVMQSIIAYRKEYGTIEGYINNDYLQTIKSGITEPEQIK